MLAELQGLLLKQTASSHAPASTTLALLRKLQLKAPVWCKMRRVRRLAKERRIETGGDRPPVVAPLASVSMKTGGPCHAVHVSAALCNTGGSHVAIVGDVLLDETVALVAHVA